MNAFPRGSGGGGRPRWSLVLALVATVGTTAALAQVVAVPAAHLNHAEGSVAWSPQGDTEWHDVQPRRVLKRGDRLWTDRGSRAEVQAGGHALRLDSQTQLVLENVSDSATQLSLTQGSVVLTVTRVNPGDTIELGTPNLAFRARQPGDYRIDVDTKAGSTRVVVLSGAAVVYGEKGEALEMHSGQRAAFRERGLARVQQAAFAASDDFDRWAGARRRGEPTVSMPAVAQAAPAQQPGTAYVNKGRDIVISGPASSLPGAKQPVTGPVATASPPFQIKGPPVATPQAIAKAQAIPNVAVLPAAPAAAPLRVTAQAPAAAPAPTPAAAPATPAPATAAQAQAQAQPQAAVQAQAAARAQAEAEAQAQAQAKAQARAQARAQAQAARAQQQERERAALQQKQEEEHRTSARRAEEERKAAAAKRAEEQHRAVAGRRAEEERRRAQEARRAEEAKHQAVARREQEQKRLQARRAEEKRLALQRKEEEKRQAAARAAEAQKLAAARKRHLARLQEQAGREEQTVRDAQAKRVAQTRIAEQERREEQARQEEQARREESDRRQRQLADQWQRDQERRNQEVWLRQQQAPQQPIRPPPMGVPFRRVS